jgi:hypothetical protein
MSWIQFGTYTTGPQGTGQSWVHKSQVWLLLSHRKMNSFLAGCRHHWPVTQSMHYGESGLEHQGPHRTHFSVTVDICTVPLRPSLDGEVYNSLSFSFCLLISMGLSQNHLNRG